MPIIDNTHYISLYVGGTQLELDSQDALRLRLNDVLFTLEKTRTTQASYSFTFDVPSTPTNDDALGYGSILSKPNKFRSRYECKVYSDEMPIFEGSLIVKGFDYNSKMYNCNLVSIKINSLDEIFGEHMLDEVPWYVPFNGAPTINSVNIDLEKKYFFPLVCYGAFQKEPYMSDSVGNEYTSKFTFDEYNKWWIESFYPSLNTMEHLKKCFEWRGYNVLGNAFRDPILSNLYESTNLADEQSPNYNLGNPRLGKIEIGCQWDNFSYANNAYMEQDLSYPYERVYALSNDDHYNFKTIDVWNVWDTTNNPNGSRITNISEQYLYDPSEHMIVVPADGWYKIHLSVGAELSGYNTTFTASQTVYEPGEGFTDKNLTITNNLSEKTPIEFQLVRNYDYNAELIKGRINVRYEDGDGPRKEWITDYPHQALCSADNPTKSQSVISKALTTSADRMSMRNVDSMEDADVFDPYDYYTTEGSSRSRRGGGARRRGTSGGNSVIGYVHKEGHMMPYDTNVNENFICGFSSLGEGTMSVLKDGHSWYSGNAIEGKMFANVDGMEYMTVSNGVTATTDTNYNANTYPQSSGNHCSSSLGTYLSGDIYCCAYLNKNDRVELLAIQRDYDGQKYACSASTYLSLEAISPVRSKALLESNGFSFVSPTEWPYDLNLSNFTNKEKRVADYVQDVLDAFNLELTQDGNNIHIDLNKGLKKDTSYAIDIDDRVSSNEAKSSMIEYPRSMSVRYQINQEEYGFEQSVPSEHIDEDDWFKWGESGYTIIDLSDDSYVTNTDDTTVNFSYTWYCGFTKGGSTYSLPTIELSEYMADGYNYEDAMAHDGYSLTQRFWFRQSPTNDSVKLSSWMDESVTFSVPMNSYQGINLSYKTTEKSLLTEYYNFHPLLSSNYVDVDIYLSPTEYIQIKSGSLVHFDSDLYGISEISGFDPSGKNKTNLRLYKKV